MENLKTETGAIQAKIAAIQAYYNFFERSVVGAAAKAAPAAQSHQPQKTRVRRKSITKLDTSKRAQYMRALFEDKKKARQDLKKAQQDLYRQRRNSIELGFKKQNGEEEGSIPAAPEDEFSRKLREQHNFRRLAELTGHRTISRLLKE